MDDRGQATGGHGHLVTTVIIAGVVGYVGLHVLEEYSIQIDPVTVALYALGGAAVLILGLGAYGAWLIGRGSDAEMQARAKAGQRTVDRMAAEMQETGQGGFRDRPESEDHSAVLSTGWLALDMLRTGNIPLVSRIEEWLGWDDEED